MKKIYILGILAFLVLSVGSASASAPYDIKVSNTGLPIDIIVTYNQATGLLTFFDNNYIAGSQGILAIAYNANVEGSDLTTVPTMASGNQAWTYNGGPHGDAKGELGTFTTSWGKTASKELERNNLRNAFFNSNEIMEQRVESFKYSVKIESSYFAAGTKGVSASDNKVAHRYSTI